MSDQEAQDLINPVLQVVGKWAIGILAALALSAFGFGSWLTKQDLRTSQLEIKAKETSDHQDAYDKRQRRIESLVVKMAQKQGIDTSRIEE